MSYIIGGGGGGGLTEAEVTTLIGRGQPNGTASLNSKAELTLRAMNANTGSTIYAGADNLLYFWKSQNGNISPYYFVDGKTIKFIGASDRNGATNTAVAAIYNPCKTIFNEHRPVCTKEYHLTGKYLDGADNPDVWFPIKGAGVGASVAYLARELKINCGTGMVSASRCVIDQTKFPITSNFLEVTCEIGSLDVGNGGSRRAVIGFQPAFSEYYGPNTDRATLINDGLAWDFNSRTESMRTVDCPIARELQPGDIVTIRLDRQEGSSNIDIARFYVNGQKQWETLGVPTVNTYAGVGVFATNSLVDVGMQLGIKYFGVRYVP